MWSRLIGAAGRHPILALVLVVLMVGAAPSGLLAQALQPDDAQRGVQRVDPRYATQSGSLKETRKRHIQAAGDEHVDSATETCGGIGTPQMAERYGLPQDDVRVARRYGSEFEPVYQDSAAEGCLKGLREGG